MKIFLTGASGFFGCEIARQLIAHAHDCAVLLRRDDVAQTRLAPLAERLTIIYGDLFAPASYRDALARFEPEALIHAAWQGVGGADRNDVRQLDNIPASGRLIEAAVASGVQMILGVGSQAEYGRTSGAITEDAVPDPTTLYAIAKLAVCQTMRNVATRGVRAVWARVFSLYGPGDEGPWLVPSLIRAFSAGTAPELTQCEQIWEFTHVADAAKAIVALLESPEASGTFNIGSGAPVRLRDAVLMLRDLIAPQIQPGFGRLAYRPDQVMHLQADISRLRKATGWAPKISLERGLEETVASFRARSQVA